MFGFQGCML